MSRKRTLPSALEKRRIVIVDNHPLLRRGLKALINAEPDMIVSAEAANHRDGLIAVAATQPDLVIADLSLDEGDGLGLVRDLRSRHPGLRLLILSMHDSLEHVRCAFAAGANGYVAKSEMTEMLLDAIRAVLRGEAYGAPEA